MKTETFSLLEATILNSPGLPVPVGGEISFTKTPKGYGYGEVIFNQLLYQKAQHDLEKSISIEAMMTRFQLANIQNIELRLPRHYPVSIENATGVFNDSQNLFVYFPDCMKAAFDGTQDANFSLEFYERSVNIFKSVLKPIILKVFAQPNVLIQSLEADIEVNIWTFSMLHELSHQAGYWYMVPKTNPKIKVNGFLKGIFGELSSDLYSAVLVPEKARANLLNLLMKCFYYPRIGYSQNREGGRLNTDNDTWEGIYLLKTFIDSGAFQITNTNLEFDFDIYLRTCEKMLNETVQLGFKVVQLNERWEQEKIIHDWMKEQLEFENGEWLIPKNIAKIFDSLLEVPELAP